MSDYIKREDAITAVKDNSYSLTDDEYIEINGYGAIEQIEGIPSADVVEVVRCKDCKFWDSDCLWCDLWGNTQEYDDGYCSEGKLKEQEHD